MTYQTCSRNLVDSLLFVVNLWLQIRFNLLSAVIVGVTGLLCLITPSISASTAGFVLTFASTFTWILLFFVRFNWWLLLTIFKVDLLPGYEICRT